MGISIRIFLINDDDSIQPLAYAKYERLLNDDPNERLIQFAGKRVRYALVAVNLENRKPVEILKAQYAYLSFDSEGRLDRDIFEEEIRVGMDAAPPLLMDENKGSVIDAKHLFAQKRFLHQFTWSPTDEIEKQIIRAIFKNS